MKEIAILLLLLLYVFIGRTQTVVSGTISDTKSKPIRSASITIKDSYDGAVSDSTGAFRFSTTEKGEQTFVITAVGYKGIEQKINLAGAAQQLSFSLKEEINEMKAVVITAGSFEASDKKRATVLNSIDIVPLPVPTPM